MWLRLSTLILLVSSAALADLSIQLTREFSGGTAPTGAAPWVTLTFADIPNGVRLTISNGGLTASEFVSGVYWNLDPTKTPIAPTAIGTGAGSQTAHAAMNVGTNLYKPDGDGDFDYFLDLPTANASRFSAGETFVLEWIAPGLTSADFEFASVNGPAGKTGFYGAAHVQGIGGNDNTSGWIGGETAETVVPEPGSFVLLAAGLAGIAVHLRRRVSKTRMH